MDNFLIPLTYDLFLFLMIVILYFCGKEIAKTGKVFSRAGLIAIVIFTLNEGLRFGRGIDYNIYGKAYEIVVSGGTTNRDFVFESLMRLFYNVGIPYQGVIIFQSFIYITAVLFLLVNYREIIAFALPFFVLFSLYYFENLIRWYIGLSFIFLGISQLMTGGKKSYFVLCGIGCFFHIGLLPIPFIIFSLFYIKKTVISPLVSIPVYILCGLFLKSSIMLSFVNYINMLTFLSERMQSFSNNAEQYLTTGALGISSTAFDNIFTIIFLFVVVWYGYYLVKETQNNNYIFTYNLFIVGFMIRPLANQIEIFQRYDFIFYCYGSVVASLIFYYFIKHKYQSKVNFFVLSVIIVFQLNFFRRPWVNPPHQCYYIWDQGKQSYDSMHSLWINDLYQNYRKTK